uniref:Putative conserved plasma membrane protein n=1 Tax=Lutzomyia longipalpis TaxID=7200 RepID=A0A7G3ADZ9_LUTLO
MTMEILPELFVCLMFYSCGAWMALNVLVDQSIYDTEMLLPEFVGIICACFIGVLLMGSRAHRKKIVFVHFYILACGTALLMICGVLCIIDQPRPIPAIYLGAVGHGIVYIAGLSYIHFRAAGRRSFRLALCHVVYIVGYATTVHGHFIYGPLGWMYTGGSFVLYSASSGLLFFLINELLHGLGVYDYKKCLDSELHLANEKKDNFRDALIPETDRRSTDTNYWATRLNVPPIVFTPTKKMRLQQQNILTLGLIFSKITNALVFLEIFIGFAFLTSSFIGSNIGFIHLYFLLGGIIFGCVISLTVNAKHLHIVYTMALTICLLTASVLYSVQHYDESGVFFWLFYFFLGFGYFLPDIGILDITNLQYTEGALASGYFIQYAIVALTRFGHWKYPENIPQSESLLWQYTGSFVGICLLLLIVIAILYPKTLNFSLLDIQWAILYKEDRWKAKNHEILAAGSTSVGPSLPRQVSRADSSEPVQHSQPPQQPDERPAFMRAQSAQSTLRSMPPRQPDDMPMFHNPWYPQKPPSINDPNPNGVDNLAYDYGSMKTRQIVPRINKIN